MKYGFIRAHAERWPVVHLCRLLKVQRSAYYDWRDQPGKVIPAQELALRRRMKELFAASRESLGSRTLMKNLRKEGFEIGRDRTRRLMKRLNLKVKQKRRYKITTNSNHRLPVAENVLNRQFQQDSAFLICEPPEDAPGVIFRRLPFLGLGRKAIDVGKRVEHRALCRSETMDFGLLLDATRLRGLIGRCRRFGVGIGSARPRCTQFVCENERNDHAPA